MQKSRHPTPYDAFHHALTRGPDLPMLDLTYVRDLQGLMASSADTMAERLITLFLTSTPTLLQDLRDAQARSDLDQIRIGLRRLQGSSAVLGGLRLAGHCTQVELVLDACRLTSLEQALTKLEDAYAALAAALENYRQDAARGSARGSVGRPRKH